MRKAQTPGKTPRATAVIACGIAVMLTLPGQGVAAERIVKKVTTTTTYYSAENGKMVTRHHHANRHLRHNQENRRRDEPQTATRTQTGKIAEQSTRQGINYMDGYHGPVRVAVNQGTQVQAVGPYSGYPVEVMPRHLPEGRRGLAQNAGPVLPVEVSSPEGVTPAIVRPAQVPTIVRDSGRPVAPYVWRTSTRTVTTYPAEYFMPSADAAGTQWERREWRERQDWNRDGWAEPGFVDNGAGYGRQGGSAQGGYAEGGVAIPGRAWSGGNEDVRWDSR